LGVSGDELLLIGLIVGTDFNDGVRGYGPKKALKLVREHRGWVETLKAVGLDPTDIEPVAEVFRHPPVSDVTPPTFGPVDESRLRDILVSRHGFSPERVQAAVHRARRRPGPPTPSGREVGGRQTMLDTFGGNPA